MAQNFAEGLAQGIAQGKQMQQQQQELSMRKQLFETEQKAKKAQFEFDQLKFQTGIEEQERAEQTRRLQGVDTESLTQAADWYSMGGPAVGAPEQAAGGAPDGVLSRLIQTRQAVMPEAPKKEFRTVPPGSVGGIWDPGEGTYTPKVMPEKTATTAMARFLQKNPRATDDEIAAFQQKLKGKGIRVTKDGLTVEVGGPQDSGTPGVSKSTASQIEKDLLDQTAMLPQLYAIEDTYKAEFLRIGEKASQEWNALKVKAQGKKALSADDRKALQEYRVFRQNTISNINEYIKKITGAQMSEVEATRLREALPDAGKGGIFGILSGDDEVTFEATLDNIVHKTRMAAARLQYIHKNGFTVVRNKKGEAEDFRNDLGESITLDLMPIIMEGRAKEMDTRIRLELPGQPEEFYDSQVSQQLLKEFGLM